MFEVLTAQGESFPGRFQQARAEAKWHYDLIDSSVRKETEGGVLKIWVIEDTRMEANNVIRKQCSVPALGSALAAGLHFAFPYSVGLLVSGLEFHGLQVRFN